MKIYIASDHAGFDLKQKLVTHLQMNGHDVHDLGPEAIDPNDDYPQFAARVTTAMRGDAQGMDSEQVRGILVCGGGQGMAIVANRVPGVRAAVVWSKDEAKATRADNDSNVLSLASRFTSDDQALTIADIWLSEPFSSAPRHRRRIEEIEEVHG